MIQLFTELQEKKNVRSNLSALRASLKEATEEQKAQAIEFVRGLNMVLDANGDEVFIALETMAGKGSEIG